MSAKMLRFISCIRNSHPDIERLYTQGQCFNFATILRTMFPGGEYWYSDIEGHMYYFYESAWYDIRGRHLLQPKGSFKYTFRNHNGDYAYRWGSRDKRRLS